MTTTEIERLRSLSGLEAMRLIASGEIPQPPMARTLGFTLHAVAEGEATFRCEPGEQHLNPMGVVHGGLALTLVDSATGVAVHSTLPAGHGYGTLDTSANLVRAITPDTGPLIAIAKVVHRGSRVATAECRVIGEDDGRLYAHGTSTCLIT